MEVLGWRFSDGGSRMEVLGWRFSDGGSWIESISVSPLPVPTMEKDK